MTQITYIWIYIYIFPTLTEKEKCTSKAGCDAASGELDCAKTKWNQCE